MKDRVILFLVNVTIDTICLFGHSWLSTSHNQKKCNRCGRMEKKSPLTGYKWIKHIPEVKVFTPVNDREV